MKNILSKEEVKSLDLPINPVRRHQRATAYLQEVKDLGTEVSISRLGGTVEIDGIRVHVVATGPVLGRRALINVAEAAHFVDYVREYNLPTGDKK